MRCAVIIVCGRAVCFHWRLSRRRSGWEESSDHSDRTLSSSQQRERERLRSTDRERERQQSVVQQGSEVNSKARQMKMMAMMMRALAVVMLAWGVACLLADDHKQFYSTILGGRATERFLAEHGVVTGQTHFCCASYLSASTLGESLPQR
eukprot:scaffold2017_cov181-Ochromonas_danica.AAC.1